MSTPLHDSDFFGWTLQQTDLLRAGRLEQLDVSSLIDEIEDMGKSQIRELESRLGVLLAHLLKWRYQPTRRGVSWETTIQEQRRRLSRLLADNPSLKSRLSKAYDEAYGDARLIARRETGLPEETFPEINPFNLEQTFDPNYWPGG
jgi:ribosomal protein L29